MNDEEQKYWEQIIESNKPNFDSEADEENFVRKILNNMGLDQNVKIEKEQMCIDSEPALTPEDDDKFLYGNFSYYVIDNGKIIIFTEASGNIKKFIKDLLRKFKSEKIFCPDRIFYNDDESKKKLILQMHKAGVEFQTVNLI